MAVEQLGRYVIPAWGPCDLCGVNGGGRRVYFPGKPPRLIGLSCLGANVWWDFDQTTAPCAVCGQRGPVAQSSISRRPIPLCAECWQALRAGLGVGPR